MSLVLTTSTSKLPAQHLLSLAKSLFDTDKLTLRQYRVWYLKYFTTLSLRAITSMMQQEGFTGHRCRPVTLPTVKKALADARRIIDLEYLTQQEEVEGKIHFAVVVCHGHRTRLSLDTTAHAAHRRLRLGIQVNSLPLPLAA